MIARTNVNPSPLWALHISSPILYPLFFEKEAVDFIIVIMLWSSNEEQIPLANPIATHECCLSCTTQNANLSETKNTGTDSFFFFSNALFFAAIDEQ
ncbi:hypothetical protein [Legionella cherrii]|uniref:hypothetical protein n=1 Tax=Legionella cherrii TaxID=28084 RepID=UPI0018D4E1FA|nr:hypothetical protein [Legionella cherrii]